MATRAKALEEGEWGAAAEAVRRTTVSLIAGQVAIHPDAQLDMAVRAGAA